MAKCSRCGKAAVTYIRYNGSHLCEDHFMEYVERRVRAEVRRQVDLDIVGRIAVALSGGKDSSVALTLLHDIVSKREDTELCAVTVDEGIQGYRPLTIETAVSLTRELGVDHRVISFRGEFETDMDEIVDRMGCEKACTFCGVLRRRCLNSMAREVGAGAIATGLNLDDTAQSILMNFTRGDVERLARLGPHRRIQPGLIPRIQPLRGIPEKEVLLYAMLRRIPFSSEECPYSERALRNEYREIVDMIEDRSPGSKYSILASYDAILPLLRDHFPPAALKLCSCGESTIKEKCATCALLEEMRKGTQQNL